MTHPGCDSAGGTRRACWSHGRRSSRCRGRGARRNSAESDRSAVRGPARDPFGRRDTAPPRGRHKRGEPIDIEWGEAAKAQPFGFEPDQGTATLSSLARGRRVRRRDRSAASCARCSGGRGSRYRSLSRRCAILRAFESRLRRSQNRDCQSARQRARLAAGRQSPAQSQRAAGARPTENQDATSLAPSAPLSRAPR